MSTRLQEFGFDDLSRFPKKISNHAVTLGLASSGSKAITVVIERGLLVPVQIAGLPNGSIIRDDGAMVYVSRKDAADPGSALEVRFVTDIPYDVRIEVFNTMRRALQADPGLNDVWSDILAKWESRFPARAGEIRFQPAGEFANIQEAFEGLKKLIQQFIEQVTRQFQPANDVPLKIVVQTMEEFQQGWQGEEFLADKVLVSELNSLGLRQYLLGRLTPKLKEILSNPLFHSKSLFRLYYESKRVMPVIKLVVIAPPAGAGSENDLRGIDFNPVLS